ncbi:MAG: ATP-binding protein, partial [Flavitalea sp.]
MFKKKRLIIITIVYWFLLLYIIAAMVWWFIELESQNRQMINYKLSEIRLDDSQFDAKYQSLVEEQKRKTAQYVYEGVTFLVLILSVSAFVYRAVRRQISLSQQQENFMMAVTHELKTPIAIAKLNLETLQKHLLDEPRRQKLLQMTLQETERLNSLASNILVSSQLETGKQFDKDDLDFSDLVKSCVSDFVSRFPDRTWNVEISPETELQGDQLLLQIMVNNLLDNAIKYSPNRSPIGCSLKEEQGHAVLTVTDEGSGIPDKEKKKIFNKFYRIGSEQTRSTKGTGLGLYLCKKIADDHRAVIRVQDNEPLGS